MFRDYVANESIGGGDVYFDDLRLEHVQGHVRESTDYYPFGGVLRRSTLAGQVPYRYGYQGDYAEQDPGTGWNSFELREYDSKIGRFTTVDPYGQFWSPYMAMGNDPVNNVDPDGGFAGPGPGFLGKLFGYKIATAANGVLGRVPGLFGNIGSMAITGLNFSLWGWEDLDKATLLEYTNKTCIGCSSGKQQNHAGRYFERKWHEWAKSNLSEMRYRENTEKYIQGSKPTVPDGIADQRIRWMEGNKIRKKFFSGSAWFEVKAKNGNIYNSTSAWQIKGHITNLAASKPQAVSAGHARIFLVTTSNVKLSPSIRLTAGEYGVKVHHVKAKYQMENNKMRIKFGVPLWERVLDHIGLR